MRDPAARPRGMLRRTRRSAPGAGENRPGPRERRDRPARAPRAAGNVVPPPRSLQPRRHTPPRRTPPHGKASHR